jgi:ABC-2 type transport system permease protein
MFVAAVTPNAQAAAGLATFLVLTMSATGGAWFPLSLMPEFMQRIGKLTLVYWAMEGFDQVLWAGDSMVQILPTVGILLGIAAVVMTLAVWRLNRSRLFD